MNLLLRLDRAQLAAGDVAVAWLWHVLGVPRRMLLRMALVGLFGMQAAAEWLEEGRIDLPMLLVGVLVMGVYHLNDMRFGANPELQRAFILVRRETAPARIMRAIVWAISIYDVVGAAGSPVWPLEMAATVFFLVFMIGGDALPPGGPRKPRRRRSAARSGAPGRMAFGQPLRCAARAEGRVKAGV